MPRKAEIGATRDSYVYRLRVPAPLKAQWDEHCAKQDKNPSVVMRALMRYIIKDEMPPEVRCWVAAQTEGGLTMGQRSGLKFALRQPSSMASRRGPTPKGVRRSVGLSTACGPA